MPILKLRPMYAQLSAAYTNMSLLLSFVYTDVGSKCKIAFDISLLLMNNKYILNMKYFAYGSNMSEERMISRHISYESRTFAKLTGYKLIFNKQASKGNYVYANIMVSENDIIEGVLYEFPDVEISKLDKFEGVPNHYRKIQVNIEDQNGTIASAITYVAKEDKIVDGLLPQKEYLNHLLAAQDLLSPLYFEKLKESPTCD